jgi:hypothetical protein
MITQFDVHSIPLFIKYSAISTGVLFYWRGTWILLDSYLFPDQPHWSAWASLLIGMLGMIVYMVYLIWVGRLDDSPQAQRVQEIDMGNTCVITTSPPDEETSSIAAHVNEIIPDNDKKCSFMKTYLFNNIKTYYFGFLVVNTWRGLWYCQDLYIVFPNTPILSPWVSHIGGIVMLMALSHFQSVLGPPHSHMPDEIIAA